VEPEAYSLLRESDKYEVARVIGELNRRVEDREKTPVLLLGPGRWGTSTPSLGVPVSFAEINNVAVLGEVAFALANAIPELSFGTHFFQDLVESNIFYFALFPEQRESVLNTSLMSSFPNVFARIIPGAGGFQNVIRLYEPAGELRLMADVVSQELVLFYG